jgi:hypothetical protein
MGKAIRSFHLSTVLEGHRRTAPPQDGHRRLRRTIWSGVMAGAEGPPLGLFGLWEEEVEEGRLSTIRCRGRAVVTAGFGPPQKSSWILAKQDR